MRNALQYYYRAIDGDDAQRWLDSRKRQCDFLGGRVIPAIPEEGIGWRVQALYVCDDERPTPVADGYGWRVVEITPELANLIGEVAA
jgi:hypothetical protein